MAVAMQRALTEARRSERPEAAQPGLQRTATGPRGARSMRRTFTGGPLGPVRLPGAAARGAQALLAQGSGPAAIVVLGQSLNPDGTAPLTLLRRAEAAAALHAECEAQLGRGPLVIATGGDPVSTGVTEASVMLDMLKARGVPDSDIVLEPRALNTLQNAWESLPLLPQDCRRIALVTSDFHMARSAYLFEAVCAHLGRDVEVVPHAAESGCPAGSEAAAASAINSESLLTRARNEARFIREEVVQIGLKQHLPGVEIPPLPHARLMLAMLQAQALIHEHSARL